MENFWHLLTIYLITYSCTRTVAIFTPVLQISQGKLRGLRSVSGQNRYYGIPYAVSKRFYPPEDPPEWKDIFYAVDRFSSCAQTVSFLTMGKEDCLRLDVYTPESAKLGNKIPVLVFIHGGAYYYGTKAHYDPEFLVTKGVIVVIINYRLGALGFLCVDGISNIGLKDQTAALKWIQNNISAFGGDPNNVIISGQSSGASSAAMHLLSERSKGLFHKAILLSGTPLAPWAFNAEQVEPALNDAAKLNNVTEDTNIYDIFSTSTVKDLLAATHDTSINSRYFKYSPCVDTNFPDPFFNGTPYDIIKSGKYNQVPVISGFASVEGMLFYGINDDASCKHWDDNFTDRISSVFSWCSKKDKKGIARKMKYHYFGNNTIDKNQITGIVNYYSDWMAYASAAAFSQLVVGVSEQPIYNYILSYEGGRNFAKLLFGGRTGLKGASHSDDIFYIFKPAGMSLLISDADRLFIDRFTTMIVNFMKYGDPTPYKSSLIPVRWPRYTKNSSLVLRLDHELRVVEMPRTHRGEFFLNLLCTYGHPGYVPCESQRQCNLDD